jgi:outer membrane protein OmpA-like peptidoglycan-associated protein
MEVVGGHIEKRSIQFVRGSTRLADAQDEAVSDLVSDIEQVVHLAQDQGEAVHITIVGHTDSTGTENLNADLSHRRAEAMLAMLVRRGLPAALFSATGVGSREAACAEVTDADRERNRRVTFLVEFRTSGDNQRTHEVEG